MNALVVLPYCSRIQTRTSMVNLWARYSLSAIFFALFLISNAFAQTSKVGGAIEGTVTDMKGAVIQGAELRIRNMTTNQNRVASTDDQGEFRAPELTVGIYEISVQVAGFAIYRQPGVIVAVGHTIRLDIQLRLAGQEQQVTVTSQAGPIQTSEPNITTSVGEERIEESPVQSRNYLDFVLLAPGVASANQQQGSGSQTPLAGSGFSFGGLRARSNDLSIDGVDNNDEYTGSSRTELSPEIVREFQVVNNGLSAEFGGASGGSINVITKSGSNDLHGDAFIFAQNGAFNARDPLENETQNPPLTRDRAGFSLGGPLVRDRTFYYAAFEQEHARTWASTGINPQLASAINTFLARRAFPGLSTRGITEGFFPVARAETEISAKINHQLNVRNSVMLRYSFTNNREASDAFNTGGLTDASARGSSFTLDHGIVGSLVTLMGTDAVNDFRFQLANRKVTLRTNDQVGPEIDINGIINFGRPNEGNSRRSEGHHEASDTLALSHGHHLFKSGVTLNRVSLDSFAPDGFGATYIFRSVSDFFAGNADSFRQNFGEGSTQFSVASFGAFVQDRWTLKRNWTVDLGLRYDVERLPAGFNQDTNNVSPRIGLAYSPSTAWVLRAGYGIFYDRYVLASLNQALMQNGTRAFEQIVDGPAAAGIFRHAAGGSLAGPVPGIAPSVFRADPRLATPYSQQTNFGVEHLLGPNLTLSANYVYVRGVKLERTRNVNLIAPSILSLQNATALGIIDPYPQQLGREVFGPRRLDPRFNDIYQIEDTANSTYHGLSITLNRRLSNEMEFSASYTFSKTLDDASDFGEQPQDPFNLRAERGLSSNHQAQRFVFSGTFDLPFGEDEDQKGNHSPSNALNRKFQTRILEHIEFAPIITIGSGRPIDALTGLDSNLSHAFPLSSRPLGFGRNTLELPAFATVNLRAVKFIPFGGRRRLDFVVESFNLFNHLNVSEINPYFGVGANPRPGFGQAIAAFNPRQIQFSLDFEF